MKMILDFLLVLCLIVAICSFLTAASIIITAALEWYNERRT